MKMVEKSPRAVEKRASVFSLGSFEIYSNSNDGEVSMTKLVYVFCLVTALATAFIFQIKQTFSTYQNFGMITTTKDMYKTQEPLLFPAVTFCNTGKFFTDVNDKEWGKYDTVRSWAISQRPASVNQKGINEQEKNSALLSELFSP